MYDNITSQRFVPTTGGTVTVANMDQQIIPVIIDPAGTLATLTVALPANPYDGQIVIVCSSQIITALTMTGTIIGAITSMAVGSFAHYVYNSNQTKWYRNG